MEHQTNFEEKQGIDHVFVYRTIKRGLSPILLSENGNPGSLRSAKSPGHWGANWLWHNKKNITTKTPAAK